MNCRHTFGKAQLMAGGICAGECYGSLLGRRNRLLIVTHRLVTESFPGHLWKEVIFSLKLDYYSCKFEPPWACALRREHKLKFENRKMFDSHRSSWSISACWEWCSKYERVFLILRNFSKNFKMIFFSKQNVLILVFLQKHEQGTDSWTRS